MIRRQEAMTATSRPRDRVRQWTLTVLAVFVLLFLYSIIADRMSQAIVQAYVLQVAPEVSGRVLEIGVSDNQTVKAGGLFFSVDPQP
jgi:multidrug resistance efflux pump